MSKKLDFPEMENLQVEKNIEKIMKKEFPLPEAVASARRDAFEKIRDIEKNQTSVKEPAQEKKKNRKAKRIWGRICGTAAAAAAVFSTVCITNPAFAQNVPLVGHVFEQIGESLGFSGDYEKHAVPLAEKENEKDEASGKPDGAVEEENGFEGSGNGADSPYTATKNGMTVTLSEVYSNDSALYVSMILKSEDTFPDTFLNQQGKPCINLEMPVMKCDFDKEEKIINGQIDGQMVDEHTFAGVLRYDWIYDGNNGEPISIPETFGVELSFEQISGILPESMLPEMPEDIRAEYEKAMADAGLSTVEEAYAGFTDEQKDLENQLFNDMWNQYYERYPEAAQHPNKYEDWWVDGPWSFRFDVTKDTSETVVKEINDVDENGLGLVSVTKTPFEITVVDSGNVDYFTVALDADGDILPYGGSGSANVWAIQDRDVSKIDVYICDYNEYMDELKGYYWSDDYQEKKKTKTFKELLDERALYHKEIVF